MGKTAALGRGKVKNEAQRVTALWRVQEGWTEPSRGGKWANRQREDDHTEEEHRQTQQHDNYRAEAWCSRQDKVAKVEKCAEAAPKMCGGRISPPKKEPRRKSGMKRIRKSCKRYCVELHGNQSAIQH